MRRLALMIVSGALWLVLAAVPALADGGPHVMTSNNGSLGLSADGCAGCHRAHTAQGPYLINAADETALCKTCHGAVATGSTVDVMTGVQYALRGTNGIGGTQLGALRGGGFDQARIDASTIIDTTSGAITNGPSRLSYYRTGDPNWDVSQRPKVGVGAEENVNSSHLAMTENGLTNPGIAWGNGAAGSGTGPAVVELSCASCHNPHGNGQYRILNKIPEATGITTTWTATILSSDATNERIYTESSNALRVGDVVTIAGHTAVADGSYTIATVNTAIYGAASNYAWFTLVGVDILANGTGGTVTRTSGVPVTDPTLPAPGDTRNYTVMQVKGTEGTESTYLLYASQVAAAEFSGSFNGILGTYTAAGGDYFARNVPWNPSINSPACDPTKYPADPSCATDNSAPNGRPSTFSGQITAWCASCHTRYYADKNPNASTTDPLDIGSSWANPRPGDNLYKYQHRTVAGRDCLTCHVSHGSNSAMTGTFSSIYTYPNGTASTSSRLLKVDNRGTCQACHDPTETIAAGTYIGPASPTVP